MEHFKINFILQELDKILPWGSKPDLSIHWFGLTDGLLWITIGEQTIYQYSDAGKQYFEHPIPYNDYQISRFIEDFSEIFRYVGESIPRNLYDVINKFEKETDLWKESHLDDDNRVFDLFYDNEYSVLTSWYYDRIFDSGHLIGGPLIGCFRYEDKIKILWNSTFKLESGESIWTTPTGMVELSYDEFVKSVEVFFESFFSTMYKQVENAVAKDWKEIDLDKEQLVKEHTDRKADFYHKINFLKYSGISTKWNKIINIYEKMKKETVSLVHLN